MTRILLFLLLILASGLTGCGNQSIGTVATVEELQGRLEREGFAFSAFPSRDLAARWGKLTRLGHSGDGHVLIALFGDDVPTRVSISLSALPNNSRIESTIPNMVLLMQCLI